MHIDKFDIATTFMFEGILHVVAKNGAIYRFDGWNMWTILYIPVPIK